ncbi:toprim domain-containing protein, partial [Phocaeicola dorei]|uniref:toprim domain-containing protein n=1 Tax=Phocaeicola dorei TaxID=357276 RepID=UPI001D3C6EB1
MKTIIAEKPSVAREIARIVKATRREAGYLTGNGYNVTWAFGHLVQPALPDGYGIKGFHPDNLPIIPPAEAQIKVIARLFRESERIIVATDAGREGELIFRYLYEYIGCATPFDRL